VSIKAITLALSALAGGDYLGDAGARNPPGNYTSRRDTQASRVGRTLRRRQARWRGNWRTPHLLKSAGTLVELKRDQVIAFLIGYNH
jgi:hypothetical protein